MRKTLLNLAFAASSLVAGAVAPYPGTVIYTQPDGTTLNVTIEGNEYGHIYRMADSGTAMMADSDGQLVSISPLKAKTMLAEANAAMQQSNSEIVSRGVGLHSSYVAHTGSPNVLVILVQFKDVKFSVSNPATYFSNFLNQEGFTTDGNSGSVRDYFKAQSTGKFSPNFQVYGPVTLGSNRSTYASTANAYKMVTEACKSLESTIDFSTYDTNNDGTVDNVYVIFAGQGSNFGASNAPWPHNSTCSGSTRVDGKLLNHYSCTCEQGYTSGQPDGIGTFIHEFGHALGFPDLYNTTTAGDDTPKYWSVMDRGNYLGQCKSPCGYSAYERHAMDWLEYRTLSEPATVNLRPLADHNFAVVVETGRSGDYYIFENRPATGFDRSIYGGGMLVWHIDASDTSALSNTPNNDSSHLRVKLVRADNNDSDATVWGDSWPGANATSFTSTSTPAMVRWNASTGSATTAVDKPITNIVKGSDGLITFNYCGGSTTNIVDPDITYHTVNVVATTGGTVSINNTAGTTSHTAVSGTTVTLNATPASGYSFVDWKLNGATVSTSRNLTITLSNTSAGTYTATFSQNPPSSLTVNVVATGGGGACINGDPDITSITAALGTRISMTALRQSGVEFDGWYYNGNRISTYTTTEIYLSVDNAGTYTAKFIPDTRKNYAHIDANSTNNDPNKRGVLTLTVTDLQGNELTVDGPGNEYGHPIYVDRTEQVLTVQPGTTLNVTGTATNTEWMHSYVYIDFGRDGRFDVDADNTGVHKDLVSHTGYRITQHSNGNDTADPTQKCDGSAVDHDNFFIIPSIVLPEDMADGTYRLRYKNDWNSNDPYGRCDYTLTGYQKANFITANGGSMIDLTLNVVSLAGIDSIAADDDAPAQYYNLMGIPVAAENLTPGIYIIRRGTTTTKAYVQP